MPHGKALAIKGVMTLVIFYLVLGLGFDMSLTNVILLTLIVGAVSYLLGDLYILPKTSNMTATLADLGMAFLLIWLIGMPLTGMTGSEIAGAALVAAIILAVGEYFLHQYILKKTHGPNRKYRASADY